MKKIAIVGAHGAGKTTLCFNTAADLKLLGNNVEIIQEQARHSPFGINDDMTIKTSLWISTNQINKELEATKRNLDYLICDRTPLDTFLYADHFGLMDEFEYIEHFFMTAVNWLPTYDKIFLLQSDLKPMADGVRSVDIDFRNKIEQKFLNEFPKFENIEIVKIETKQDLMRGLL